jgi:hypothetical protein
MSTSKTKFIEATGEIYYARVFPQNMDDGDFHTATGGQYNCVFIPADDTEMAKLVDAGFPQEAMGHKQIKPFEVAGGRTGMKLKRPNKHPKIDDFGGAPKVLNWTEGRGATPWDFDVDGALGGGTKVTTKVSIYTGGRSPVVRLEGVAVLDHVPQEESSKEEMVW